MRQGKRAVEVVLPTVTPPELYLVAVVYLREIAGKMRDYRSLAALAEAAGAPFLGDEIAEFVSATLIPQIHRQALAASKREASVLTPRVRGRPRLLAEAAVLLERWGRWLQSAWSEHGTLIEAADLPAPPANIGVLLTWVSEQLRAQTAGQAGLLGVGGR